MFISGLLWGEPLMADRIASPRNSKVESVSILLGHHGFQANFEHCILILNKRIAITCCKLTKVWSLVTSGEDFLSPFDSKTLPRALSHSLSNSEYVYHQSQGWSSSSNGTNWSECLHVDGSVGLSGAFSLLDTGFVHQKNTSVLSIPSSFSLPDTNLYWASKKVSTVKWCIDNTFIGRFGVSTCPKQSYATSLND